MRVSRLVAQAFRGFPARVEVVLTGDVVLLYGENGAGKSSLTEAFEWCIFGAVVRKSRSKSPGEYGGWGWLRSVHSPPESATFVEVELVAADGASHVVRRDLVAGQPRLTIDGTPAEDIRGLGIPTEDALRPFLGQCEIQGLIDSGQQERWEQLSAILGFGAFGALRARLQRLRTNTDHDARVQAIRDAATRVVRPLVPEGEDPLVVDPEHLRKRASSSLGLDEDAGWGDIGARAIRDINELYARNPRPAALERLLIAQPQLGPSAGELHRAIDMVVDEVQQHRQWHRLHQRASFMAEGLRLLDAADPERCPFCGQQTVTPDARALAAAAAASAPAAPPDHRDVIRQALGEVTAAGPLNHDVIPALVEALKEGLETEQLRALATRQEDLDAERRRLRGLGEGFLAASERARSASGDDESLRSLADQLVEVAGRIASIADEVRTKAEELRIGLEESLSQLTPDEHVRLRRLQVARILAEETDAVRKAWRVRGLQIELAGLIARLETIEKREMAAALERLSADISRYYETLSPGHHIRVTGVSVRDTRHRQAALSATSFGRPINPVTMFSEAQGNCLGLSLYFSQRVDRNPAWQMILLDDPVQSMDEGHEQGLVQLLANVSRGRQVIVLTHDRRFASAFEAQFQSVEGFMRYDLVLSGEPHPRLELKTGRLNELFDFVQGNATGDRAMRESCAAALRKAVECFVRDLAAKHSVALRRRATADDRIARIGELGFLDPLDSGTLQRIRLFGNPNAHDDPSGNAARGAIVTNLRALRDLQARYLLVAPALRLVMTDAPEAG